MDIIFILISIIYTFFHTEKFFTGGMPYFFLAQIVLLVFVLVLKNKRESISITAYTMLHMVAIFLILFVTYQQMVSGRVSDNKSEHTRNILVTLIMGIGAGGVSFWTFRHAGKMLKRIIGMLAIPLSILLLFIVRFASSPVGNAYIAISGMLVVGPILMMQPFIASLCLTNGKLNEHLVMGMSVGKVLFIGVNGVIVLISALLCRDLGSCLIIGLSTAWMLLPAFKENRARLAVILAGIAAVGFMILMSSTFQERIQECMFTADIVSGERLVEDPIVKDEAAKILDLQVHFFQQGWYGSGYNAKGIDNIENDYVLYGMIYDYGTLFFLALVVFTLCFVYYLVRYMSMSERIEDQAMARMGTYLIAVPMLYIILSNVGIVPLTGISFPYLSAGKSLFITYGMLTGMLVAIQQNNEYLLS